MVPDHPKDILLTYIFVTFRVPAKQICMLPLQDIVPWVSFSWSKDQLITRSSQKYHFNQIKLEICYGTVGPDRANTSFSCDFDWAIRGQFAIPTGLCSDRSIFRQVYIPTGRYSDRSLFRLNED